MSSELSAEQTSPPVDEETALPPVDTNLRGEDTGAVPRRSVYKRTVAGVAWFLQHPNFHKSIIVLTLIDAICVFIDLAYTFLRECNAKEHHERPVAIDVFTYISITIVSAFLVEIPITIWAIGIQFYNPFKRGSAGKMHFFDAAVIIATFVLEVALRGKERELAGLLVILRLWRLFELAESIALTTTELHEGEMKEVRRELERYMFEVEKLKVENGELRQRIAHCRSRSDPFSSSPERQEAANVDPERTSI
ncbi:hypothetical protein CVT24_008911 [Panaeolus cyanescens]|uniref:Voltage-gated hydrogen channel 1 n=1 Tax=Panaeolus cyanescens TaxID=181874 RepID=A0A409VAZ0_9AGAR|nr:hypothetical protein CVT24_008911 [Panaeolus cyanescens]